MKHYPTPWQTRMLWTSLTSVALAALVAVIVGGVWATTEVISFLKPVLIPFAVSGVLAYLLDPIVTFLCRRARMSRTRAVVSIFAAIFLVLGLLGLTVLPGLYRQSVLVRPQSAGLHAEIPTEDPSVARLGAGAVEGYWRAHPDGAAIHPRRDPSPAAGDSETNAAATPAPPATVKRNPLDAESLNDYFDTQINKLQDRLPAILNGLGGILVSSIGGFFGIIGFIVSAILIPSAFGIS